MTEGRGLRPIADVADDLGFGGEAHVPAGRGVARLPLTEIRDRIRPVARGRLILVTGINPTEHGEGKTVVTIALSMALHRRGRPAVACLRQPSLGPVFGGKGGASGGGRSALEPRPAIDLGFTGDLDAIANAQNLLATLVDNSIFYGNPLAIDPIQSVLPRVSPLEDRALRDASLGLTVRSEGFPRPGQFVIAPACEIAAIHGLTGSVADLSARLDRMVVARRRGGDPVRAAELGATGAVASLLVGALAPNLVQTVEGTPALVHGVPYANVAHGTCSRLALEAALASADFAVVEAGFASELGAEKFVDLVQPQTGRPADAAVIVVTVRALEWHGSDGTGSSGAAALERGLANLEQHVANLRRMGLDPVIAVNRFPADPPGEVEQIGAFCAARGLAWAPVTAFADGSAGAAALAALVESAAAAGRRSHSLYDASARMDGILRTLAVDVYGGAGASILPEAQAQLDRLRRDGGPDGPVCVAKTPLSLSTDPTKRGRPTGFTVEVRRFVRWSGAGFTVAYAGSIVAMPGLPKDPAVYGIRISDDGTISGLR